MPRYLHKTYVLGTQNFQLELLFGGTDHHSEGFPGTTHARPLCAGLARDWTATPGFVVLVVLVLVVLVVVLSPA